MSTLAEIENAITQLSPAELAELSRWLQTMGPRPVVERKQVDWTKSVVFTHPRDKGPIMSEQQYRELWDHARGSALDG